MTAISNQMSEAQFDSERAQLREDSADD